MTVTEAVSTTGLPSGEHIPRLGQGTWHMAENPLNRSNEIKALRLGIDLGMSLIDTAEMYADGRAERLVGEVIKGRRHEIVLVSKVLPQNATRHGTMAACNRSLARLGVHEIDLYLLHWRGPTPLEETVDAFETLVGAGKIRKLGRQQFRYRRHAETRRLAQWCQRRGQSGALQSRASRHRVRPLAMGVNAGASPSWPIRRSSRAVRCACRTQDDRGASRRDPGTSGAGLGATPGRRMCDTAVGQAGACSREPWCAGRSPDATGSGRSR
jgi:hypothetical protein